jgi:hypothetical protein
MAGGNGEEEEKRGYIDGQGYLTKARLIAKWERNWGQGPNLLGPWEATAWLSIFWIPNG